MTLSDEHFDACMQAMDRSERTRANRDPQTVYTVEVVGRDDGPYLFADQHDADRFALAVGAAGGNSIDGRATICDRDTTTELIKQETADVEPIPYGVAYPMNVGTAPDGWSWVQKGDDEDVFDSDEDAAQALISAGIGTDWSYFNRRTHMEVGKQDRGAGYDVAINAPEPDRCDECGASEPRGAATVEGPWHLASCSAHTEIND